MIKVRLKPTKAVIVKPNAPTVKLTNKFIKIVEKISFSKPANLWVRYEFKDRGGYICEQEKLCVEAYCCGFLTYYEYVARNRMYNFSQVYFKWVNKEKGEKAFTSVEVYLDPPPKKKLLPRTTSHTGSPSLAKNTIQAATGMQAFSDPTPAPYPPPPPMG